MRTPEQRESKRKWSRSKIADGKTLLPGVYPHGRWPRLVGEENKRLIEHAGGDTVISEPRRLAARRAAVLEAELVEIEIKIATVRAEGKEPAPSVIEHYGRLSERQRRHLETLGLERVAKDITPSIELLVAESRQAGATDVEGT